jgi:predicted ATPase/transcriptional regulator with XRE-family HTH domain
MDTGTSFGAWVSVRRRVLNLSRAALAQRVGCAVVTIRKIEADERRPSAQIADRLARELGVPPEQHTTFVRAARAEAAVDRLPPPNEGLQPVAAAHTPIPPHWPAPRSPLVGREREAAALLERLLHDDVSLLTLTGPPGVGKTRLALQVAANASGLFAAGACFVALAPLSDSSLVAAAIAQTLGVKETRALSLADSLVSYLRSKHILLLLDNFEHVIGAAPLISELLAAAPRLKVLVTSRAGLRISAEHEFPLAPLGLPDIAAASPDEQREAAAVRLFVQRAQALNPALALDAADIAAVAEICRRLDGLPLAIELAAARSRLFTPQALLARLTSRLRLLTGGMRDLPERQQTLQNAIAWSYDLLAPPEQALFRQLSVFAGGCTLEAAEAITTLNVQTACPEPAEGFERSNVLDALTALVDHNLIWQEAGPEGEVRLGMFETIREYAHERLAEHGELAALRRRHAEYFLSLAERAEPLLQCGAQIAWLERLAAEHDNLRAALGYCLGASEPEAATVDRERAELGLRLAGALWLFWQVRSYYREGRAWLERALALTPAEPPTRARVKALNGAGFLRYCQYDYAQAERLLEQSLELARAIGDRREMAHVLNNIGTLANDLQQRERAIAFSTESLALAREQGQSWIAGWALLNLARVATEQHQLQHANDLFEQALATFQSIDGKRGMAIANMVGAYIALLEGQVARSAALLEAALELSRELGDKHGLVYNVNDLARIALLRGEHERAGELLADATVLARELEDRYGLAWALVLQGRLWYARAAPERARSALAEGLELAVGQHDHELICLALASLARVLLACSQPSGAARLLGAREAVRIGTRAPLLDRDVAECEALLADVRACLAPGAFAAAWESGQATPLREVIAGLAPSGT